MPNAPSSTLRVRGSPPLRRAPPPEVEPPAGLFVARRARRAALVGGQRDGPTGGRYPKTDGATSGVRLLTRAAVVEKIAYTLANPVAAGLVWSAREWPGATVRVGDLGQGVLRAR